MTADYEEALAAALDELGVPLLHVTCDRCQKSRTLGTVSRTSRGLLFQADVEAADVWSQLPENMRQRLNTTGTKGPKYKVANLVDWPTVAWTADEGPRVWCHTHGTFVLDHNALAAAAHKAATSRRSPNYIGGTRLTTRYV